MTLNSYPGPSVIDICICTHATFRTVNDDLLALRSSCLQVKYSLKKPTNVIGSSGSCSSGPVGPVGPVGLVGPVGPVGPVGSVGPVGP